MVAQHPLAPRYELKKRLSEPREGRARVNNKRRCSKMTYEIIKVEKGISYIKDIPEFKQDLPDNVYLDKVNTGCGFTVAVLQNNVNYVLAIPFQSLGDNKLLQSVIYNYPHELFLYHSGVEDVGTKLTEYLERNKDKVKKIMVTYDSLPKLKSFIDFKEYKLAIDEGHKLLEYAGNFKPKVIHNLFEELPNFRAYIVATATPTREEYIPVQLKDTKKIKIEWSSVTPVNFKHKRLVQNQLFEYLVSICLAHYRQELEGNAYIFINSVKDIVRITKTLVSKFNLDDIKIITAINDKNLKLVASIGSGWKPKPVIEENNPTRYYKINFITSTAFEGQDFLDPDGVTYIVSDGKLEHTKLDISTQVSQIVGRLRVSKHKDKVNMLWTQSPIGSYKTEEDYREYVKLSRKEAEEVLEDFQKVGSLKTKAVLVEGFSNDIFFIDNSENGIPEMILNPNAENHLMNNFVGTGLQYFVNTKDNKVSERVSYTLRDIFLGTVDDNLFVPCLSALDKRKFRVRANFPQLVRQYFTFKRELYQYKAGLCSFGEHHAKMLEDYISDFETDADFSVIIDYLNLFGLDTDIRNLSDSSLQPKVFKAKITKYYESKVLKDILQTRYKEGETILKSDLKQEIKRITDSYNLTSKFKIVDIFVAFKCKETGIRVNGKKENAIKLLEKL